MISGGSKKVYRAFISYRHADNAEQDRPWASWLHEELERFEVPADLIDTDNAYGATIPARLFPVFRDEASLAAQANLSSSIADALKQSEFMIVICSPRAVNS